MDTAERLLALLGLLQYRWHWSADELADRLGVTTRTVRRDVARLRGYGYPIEAFAGHGGGYQLGRGAAMPPLLLDDDEAIAVALGLGVVGVAGSDRAGVDDAAVSALAKIEQLLPARLRARIDELSGAITATSTTAARRAPAVDRRVLAVLARAVHARLVTTFHYVDGRGAATSRRVEPVRLVRARGAWYLAAFDRERDDWRTFRLDRVGAVEIGELRFAVRTGPDPVELVARSAPASVYAHRVVVVVDAPAAEVRARVPASIAEPVHPAEASSATGSTWVIGSDDLEWAVDFVLGLPWSVEVLAPPAARASVAGRAARLLAAHSPLGPDG